MITVEVRDELSDEESVELVAMISEAAAYDEEAGFSSVDLRSDLDGNTEVFHVLTRLTPGLHGSTDTPLAAYLRLSVDRAGGAVAQMVVRPEYRSLGIATLTLETLSALEGTGWAGTGAVSISCWARGDHPAAERMSGRFGAEIEGATWTLLRGAEMVIVDPADEAAVLTARRDGFVHEQTDVRYVWRVPAPAVTEPTA
jgi:mycothiol synthase